MILLLDHHLQSSCEAKKTYPLKQDNIVFYSP